MANTILLKRSAVAGKVPTTSDVPLGSLALNTYDGKLFTKKSVSGVESIVEIGASSSISDGDKGDITVSGSGATWTIDAGAVTDTKLATISTAGKVANSATTATSANTASAIVARDASGNFSAGTITAALSGNASTASTLQTARAINGVNFNGSSDITVTASTPSAVTFNNAGAGVASGSTFNGGSAVTVSYNSIGAPSTTGANASGTWGISVTGTASNITSYTINQNLSTSSQVSFDSVITSNNGNGTNYRVGDDAWIGDINVANTIRVQGLQNAANAYIVFGSADGTALGRAGSGALTYGGNTVVHSANISSYALPIGGGSLTGDLTLNARADLRFADADSSNWVAFQAPATVSSNVTWTLPAADGTSGQVLSTNGSGVLSWATSGGGSSPSRAKVFFFSSF